MYIRKAINQEAFVLLRLFLTKKITNNAFLQEKKQNFSVDQYCKTKLHSFSIGAAVVQTNYIDPLKY